MYTYRARVSRVVDGDTVDLAWVDLGWGIQIRPSSAEPLRIRFAGINAYETSLRGGTTPEQKLLGLEAKSWLQKVCEGEVVRIQTVKGGERGNFGRYLAWVWTDGPEGEALSVGESLNMQIVDHGWGVLYE